jgi:LPXTG-site transpeptidase (sortase) family protein
MVSTSSLSGVRLPLAPQVVAHRMSTLLAQESVSPRELGEQPTSGGARPGPVNAVPGLRAPGVMPVELAIKVIDLDAAIEQQEIEDGVMQNPSGPFVVAWYKETGRLGETQNNVVLAGHLDYWDVGPAVFYDIWKLESGNKIHVTGKNGAVFVYKVEWVKDYKIDDLDSAAIQDIIGPTKNESVTLITCGGTFDYDSGEYEARIVVRGNRITG